MLVWPMDKNPAMPRCGVPTTLVGDLPAKPHRSRPTALEGRSAHEIAAWIAWQCTLHYKVQQARTRPSNSAPLERMDRLRVLRGPRLARRLQQRLLRQVEEVRAGCHGGALGRVDDLLAGGAAQAHHEAALLR